MSPFRVTDADAGVGVAVGGRVGEGEVGHGTVAIGTVDHRIALSDDPAVLLVLLYDSVGELEAIAAG